MIQSALIGKLLEVSSSVYASIAEPEASLPCITVDMNGSTRIDRHFGAGGYQTGFVDTDFEISVWAKTAGASASLAASVVSLLENYAGPLRGIDSPQTVYSVGDIEIVSEFTSFDERTKLYEYSIDITITHTLAS